MVKENWRENLLRPNFDLKGYHLLQTIPQVSGKQGPKLDGMKNCPRLKNWCNQSGDFYSLDPTISRKGAGNKICSAV
jgi:hypothetical protein